jgi:GR25 family glycosyltransferase involved in LPS biosynthesis
VHTSKMDWNSATAKATTRPSHSTVTGQWSFVDRIYCISLKDRADRRSTALAQFAAVGLAGAVEFVVVDKHPSDSEQGIYESHLSCMKRGLAAAARRILIFEDDVVFRRFSAPRIKDINTFMRDNGDWQAFFLGCLVNSSRRTDFSSVVRIDYRSLSHAYVVTAAFARDLIANRPWSGVAFDAMLRDVQSSRMYALYPSIAFQSSAASDNDRYLPLDRFRRLCGGLEHIQRCNEFYQLHKRAIIGGHLLALLAIGLMCFGAIR